MKSEPFSKISKLFNHTDSGTLGSSQDYSYLNALELSNLSANLAKFLVVFHYGLALLVYPEIILKQMEVVLNPQEIPLGLLTDEAKSVLVK